MEPSFCVPQESRTKSQSTRRTIASNDFLFFFVMRETSVRRRMQTLLCNFSHFKSHLSSRPVTPTQSCAVGTAHPLQHFKGSKAIFKAKMQSRLLFYEALVKEEQSRIVIFYACGPLTKRLNAAIDEIVQAGSFGQMSQRHHHSELGDLGQAGMGGEGAAGWLRL